MRFLRRLFKKKEFENEVIEELEDNEEETLLILNHYEQNKEEIKKWDSKNLLTRLELDRQNSYKINFCFIPKNQNYKKVRSYIQYLYGDYEKWQSLRKHFIRKHNSTCQCCNRQFKELELHEQWSFDDFDKIQKLDKLILLCKECHSIAHITRHKKEPQKIDELLDLYCLYNKIEISQAWKDFEFHEELRKKRNGINYQLDLSYLNNFSFNIENLFDCHTDKFNSFIYKFSTDNKDEKE